MSSVAPQVYNGRYELSRLIARGGMADVYLAHDRLLDRPVALKALFPELSIDRSFVERFRREAQAAANLSHPNIVSVYDWGEAERTYFIVMELVNGWALSAVLRSEGPLLADRAASVAADVALALGFAHSHGVVHRDVKPGNILITGDGMVKVTDFGIARATNTTESLTQTGAVMGTATYFSPEQAQGISVDARSDIYSLGVVLYECVTGQPPFAGDSPVSVAYKHVRETPVPPRQIRPDIPEPFEAIVLQAMAKDPQDRYQTAQELRADLLRYRRGSPVLAGVGALGAAGVETSVVAMGDGTRALPALEEVPPGKGDKRLRFWIGLLVVLLIALGVVLALVTRNLGLWGSSPPAADIAVPSLVNQPVGTATTTLSRDGLRARVERAANAAAKDTVFDQSPGAGTKLARGQTVILDVSNGPATVTVPSVLGLDITRATATLQDDGLNVSTVFRASSSVGQGTVLAQDPSSGTQVNPNATVVLTVATPVAPTTTTTTTTLPPTTTTTSTTTTTTSTTPTRGGGGQATGPLAPGPTRRLRLFPG